ncbi:MAG: trigger factor [Eubacteriaceae bacterium]|jgi:trigger factor|nr:trigger factor [Eubacteriaceae bacterium]
MKATFISKEGNEAKFKMEFTAEDLENAVIKAYQATKDRYSVDGFRKGKAPRSIIEKHYGENVFMEDAVNDLINNGYPEAVGELDLNVIDRPSVDFDELKKGEDFTVTVKVQVYPEIEIKDYKGVEIKKIDGETSEEDIDQEMENLRKRNARLISVEREAADGDTVVIDYAGFVGDDQFEGGTSENYPLVLGSNTFIPGFEEQLVGVKAGDSKDVTVTFPEDYNSEDLAGKEAVFHCTVHEVKTEELPELDDEFAKDISEFDTLEELRNDTAEKLKKSKESQAVNMMKDAALEEVYKKNDFDVPEVMVEDELDQMIREFDQQLRMQGMDIQKYFQYLGKTPEEFRKDIRDDAFKRVKMRMIITAIAEIEKIEATNEDVDKEVDLMAIQYSLEADKIREMLGEDNMAYMEQDIKMRKAVDVVYDNANQVEKKAEDEEEDKKED